MLLLPRLSLLSSFMLLFFFFNDTATTEIYTLSLHDALPIFLLFSDAAQNRRFVLYHHRHDVALAQRVGQIGACATRRGRNVNGPPLRSARRGAFTSASKLFLKFIVGSFLRRLHRSRHRLPLAPLGLAGLFRR